MTRDYGYAYEMEIREVTDHLCELRSHGSRARQYVPGIARTIPVDELDDADIRACAIFDAERHTNMAINMRQAATGAG